MSSFPARCTEVDRVWSVVPTDPDPNISYLSGLGLFGTKRVLDPNLCLKALRLKGSGV